MFKKIAAVFSAVLILSAGFGSPGTGNPAWAAAVPAGLNAYSCKQTNPFAGLDSSRNEGLIAACEKYSNNDTSMYFKSPAAKACSETSGNASLSNYIVKFKNSVSFDEIQDLLAPYPFDLIGGSSRKLFAVKADSAGLLYTAFAGKYTYIEPDKTVKLQKSAEDPRFSEQWALSSANIPAAWDITTGSPDVTVAMIDSGIYRNHEDLAGADIRQGYDYVTDRAVTGDVLGHGTETTGVVAAAANNGIGIAGICWNVGIIPMQVFLPNGEAYTSRICEALYGAADMGVDVINLSLGSNEYDAAENEAVQYAVSKGCIIVASAGNDHNTLYTYPASYDGVISAASVNSELKKSDFSNYNNAVDVAAPGEHILSVCSVSSQSYAYVSGTSYSSPCVAGIAALVKAYDRSIDCEEFQYILKNTSTDLGTPGYDTSYGYGLINAANIFDYLKEHRAVVTFDSNGGSAVKKAVTAKGSLIPVPANPSKAGYIFAGWYKEAACINAWNFSAATVSGNTTLYAKWIAYPAAPADLKAAAATGSSIRLTWTAVGGAEGYEVFRVYPNLFNLYQYIGGTTAAAYTCAGLTVNNTYTFQVRAYITVNGQKVPGSFSASVSASPVLPPPGSLKAVSNSYNSIKVSWAAVSGAGGYEIYRLNTSTGSYSLLTASASTSYIHASLQTNTTYTYKVRAYVSAGGKKVYSDFTKPVSSKPVLSVPGSFTAARASSTSIKLSWKAVAGASGYVVYRAASSTGTFSLVKTTSAVSFMNTGLAKNKTYYYKVRAYRTVNSVNIYGAFSAVKSCKTY